MKDKEIYSLLLEKTKDLEIVKPSKVFDMASICLLLSQAQVSSSVLKDSFFLERKEDWSRLMEGYKPNAILKKGSYQKQWERVEAFFTPERKTPFKEMTQAIFHAARFLSRFDSFEAFRKEMYLQCVDEESTLSFMLHFRLYASISNMYFAKTCLFFNRTGLFELPVVNRKCKDFLLPLLPMEDENEKIYKKILQICKSNHISVHEFNQRVENIKP